MVKEVPASAHVDSLRIGRKISPIGIGCWQAGGLHINRGRSIGWQDVDEEQVIKAFRAASEAGVTLFDTADSYGENFASVRRLARVTRSLRREDYCLAIKVGYHESTPSLRWEHIGPRLIEILGILGTSHCELFSLHHNGQSQQDRDAVVETLHQARRLGLALAVGVRIGHIPTHVDLDQSQHRSFIESDIALAKEVKAEVLLANRLLQPAIRQHQGTVFFNKPLAQGRYFKTASDAFIAGDTRYFQRDFRPQSIQRVAKLKTQHQVSNELLLRYAIHSAVNVLDSRFAFFGVRTAQHVHNIVAAYTTGPLPLTQARQVEAFLDIVNNPIGFK